MTKCWCCKETIYFWQKRALCAGPAHHKCFEAWKSGHSCGINHCTRMNQLECYKSPEQIYKDRCCQSNNG